MRSPPPLSELLTRAIQEVESTELKVTDLFHISPTYDVFQHSNAPSAQFLMVPCSLKDIETWGYDDTCQNVNGNGDLVWS